MRYTVVIEKGRESGFVAHCPVLKGCVAQCATKQKALANIREAMRDYLETLAEDGLPLPTEVGRHYVDGLVVWGPDHGVRLFNHPLQVFAVEVPEYPPLCVLGITFSKGSM